MIIGTTSPPIRLGRLIFGSGARPPWCFGASTIHRLPWRGLAAYAADVPKAQIHLLDAGHFAMDEDLEGVARLTREFLGGLRLGGG